MVAATALPSLIAMLNAHKKRLLQAAQVGFAQQHQFDAFRSILLDELGRDGFEKELEEALQHKERNETGRHTHAGKEVPK
ncbi:MAG TPA: hypothetical protein VMV91_03045 [Rhodocyclaceae bacterium]|nr:hypothetical protein [Rhodocyclaceae bacterium]